MNINEMTDETKLTTVIELIESGVDIETAFVKDEDSDVFTHQIMHISCGEYSTLSHPQPLNMPLVPATGGQLNKTVN